MTKVNEISQNCLLIKREILTSKEQLSSDDNIRAQFFLLFRGELFENRTFSGYKLSNKTYILQKVSFYILLFYLIFPFSIEK